MELWMKGTKVQTLAMRLHFILLTSNEDVNSHVVDVYITCNEKYVKSKWQKIYVYQ